MISMGGSSEPAARRAARIADGFMPSEPAIWAFYQDEMVKLGKPDPGPYLGGDTSVIALAEDADAGWEQLAPFFLHEMNAYGAWQAQDDVATGYQQVSDTDVLAATGQYRVLTPDQYVAELQAAGPFAFSLFHPLCGGIPPELAWKSLRLYEHEVLPRLGAGSRFMSAANQPDEHALAMAHAHAAAEGSGDLTTTLATLDDDPVYEFQPVGRVFRGKDTARRYYEHFFAHFSPLTESFEIRGEWSTPEGLGQEYTVWLRLPDGTRERHEIIGILLFGTSGLAGERVYASERLLRLMLGPIYDETTPLEAEEHS